MKNFRLKLVGFTVFCIVSFNLTQTFSHPNLQNLTHRPTVSEFLAAYNGVLPNVNPYTLYDYNQVGASLLNSYRDQLASIIAQFEKAFPGATFVGLGRDSALLVDALDAFYLNLGQKGRAIHFNASGSTFQRVSMETIVKYTQQLGLNFDHIAEQPPFIFFDGTRYSNSSQSHRLIEALYTAGAAKNIDPKDLVNKINFVSTSYNGYSYYPYNWIMQTDTKQFLENQKMSVTSRGPEQILSVDGWFLTHGFNWTNTFMDLTLDANGVYQAVPSSMMSQVEQNYVLGHIYYVIALVRSPEFIESVKREALRLGYNFEENLKIRADGLFEQVAPIVLEPMKSYLEKLDDLRISPVEGEREYHKKGGLRLSENGQAVWSIISEQINNGFTQEEQQATLQRLADFETADKIGERDFSRILFALLPHLEFTDADMEILRSHHIDSRHLYEKIEERLADLDEDLKELSGISLQKANHNKNKLWALFPQRACAGALR